jgi:hypothetical protein
MFQVKKKFEPNAYILIANLTFCGSLLSVVSSRFGRPKGFGLKAGVLT